MNHALQRHCMFSMEINTPGETLRTILDLLQVQQMPIEDLQLIKLTETESKLVFLAWLEMDRMRSLKGKLSRIKKIKRLECLYDQQRDKLYQFPP
jgi:hypothetical protein